MNVIEAIIKIAVLVGGLMTAAAYFVLLERWIAAWVQMRRGPNRVGIPLTQIRMFGLGQPLADGLKFIMKEEYTPAHVDKALFILAPIVILASALAIFAVIPLGGEIPLESAASGVERPIALMVAPHVDVGLIYVFALNGIAVYGVILGAWASNNKYSFLGGLRSSAQLISYEIPLSLGILAIVLMCGSLRLDVIVSRQAETGLWNVFVQPLGFVVFCAAAFAEAARLPFDLPEAEQELIGGYHTEYSGMKLLLFLIGEFLHMITAAFLITILFLGGWHFWGIAGISSEPTWISAILGLAVLFTKTMLVILFFMLVRWSWPRFRFDQLMDLAWKVMVPLGLANFVAMAVLIEYGNRLSSLAGLAPIWVWVAGGWLTVLAGWVVAAVWAPLQTDNRPRTAGFAMTNQLTPGTPNEA